MGELDRRAQPPSVHARRSTSELVERDVPERQENLREPEADVAFGLLQA